MLPIDPTIQRAALGHPSADEEQKKTWGDAVTETVTDVVGEVVVDVVALALHHPKRNPNLPRDNLPAGDASAFAESAPADGILGDSTGALADSAGGAIEATAEASTTAIAEASTGIVEVACEAVVDVVGSALSSLD
jgi:hypothetical protein